MEESSWTSHVLAGAAWRRFAFMLIFVPVLCCALFLMGFTALFQFFSMLASGETNPQLTGFGHGLARFSAEIMDYLTYNTEQRPFPFTRWRGDDMVSSRVAPAVVKTPRAKRSPITRRKRGARTASKRRSGDNVERIVRPQPVPEPEPDSDFGGGGETGGTGPKEHP
ncbi:MAG: DUF4389 domain-containing protein [Gammaproteobacteria bacterium]